MFINKARDGRNNICGECIAKIRASRKLSQRQLADLLQLQGLDVDKNAVQRIEIAVQIICPAGIRTVKNDGKRRVFLHKVCDNLFQ